MKTFNNEQPSKCRNNDVKLLNAFKVFETTTQSVEETCGNIKECYEYYNMTTHSYDTKYGKEQQNSFYHLVSAPMLLSRLIAAGFTPTVYGQDGYKVTWEFVLKHKDTGHIVTFYDFKGGPSFGSDVYGDNVPESFKKDLLRILKALINPRFPHPYDGCVVGEIA